MAFKKNQQSIYIITYGLYRYTWNNARDSYLACSSTVKYIFITGVKITTFSLNILFLWLLNEMLNIAVNKKVGDFPILFQFCGSRPLISISHDCLINYGKVCQIWVLFKCGVLLLYGVTMAIWTCMWMPYYILKLMSNLEMIYTPKYHTDKFPIFCSWNMDVGGCFGWPGSLWEGISSLGSV